MSGFEFKNRPESYYYYNGRHMLYFISSEIDYNYHSSDNLSIRAKRLSRVSLLITFTHRIINYGELINF